VQKRAAYAFGQKYFLFLEVQIEYRRKRGREIATQGKEARLLSTAA